MAQQQGVGVPDVFGAHAGDTLAAPSGQALSLEGEVVEIFEKGGQRLAKIMLRPRTVLDVAAGEIVDVHLGDHVVISGLLTVETVSASTGLKPCAATGPGLDRGDRERLWPGAVEEELPHIPEEEQT